MRMAYNTNTALGLVKARLNRLNTDTSLDEYLSSRIEAADQELARIGIALDAESVDDTMLLADLVVWQYQSRDSGSGMPDWLRLRRRERWLNGDDT
jgi:hypothetical protein